VFGQSSYPATWPTTEVRSEDAFVCDTYDRVHGEGKGAIEDEIRNAEFIAHAPEDIDALLAENARLTAERDAQLAAARRASDRRAWQVKERARAVAHSTDDAHVIRRLLTELGTDERSQPDPAAQRDALARGEDTPSLDAIRAHGGVWVVTDGSTATTLSLRVDAATVYAVDACGCDLRYDAGRFAEMHAGCRWWRVRGDGTLAVGEPRGEK
jgi:hypothetical protein